MLKWIVAIAFFIVPLNALQAATAKKISKKKRIVQINAGSKEGYVTGEKVCFFNKRKKKVACGKIVKAKKNSSYIRVSKKRVARIKKGYEATLASAGKSSIPPKSAHFIKLRGFWSLGLANPATYNNLTYLPAEGDSVDTLWESSGSADGLLTGFGLEAEMPSLSTVLGFRYRIFQAVEFSTDYVNPVDNYYVNGSISGQSIGFYADYFLFKLVGVDIGAGLDIDMSSVSMLATKMDADGKDDPIDIASVSSSMTAISLRFPVRYVLDFGMMGLSFGINFMLPIMGEASPVADIQDETNGAKLSVDPAEDASFALGHQRNSIAFEIVSGVSLGF